MSHAEAQFNLALLYLGGGDIPRDPARAVALLESASAQVWHALLAFFGCPYCTEVYLDMMCAPCFLGSTHRATSRLPTDSGVPSLSATMPRGTTAAPLCSSSARRTTARGSQLGGLWAAHCLFTFQRR